MVTIEAAPDKRYRVKVNMMQANRPRYWIYLCNNCGSKIAEVQNLEVYSTDDFYDPQNINNTGIARHCKGYKDGMECPYTYLFQVQ